MTRYDALFDELAATDSVFADKRALDPLATPAAVRARPGLKPARHREVEPR